MPGMKPDERIVQAEKMFREGTKLVDIARQLDLPEGTVRRWKSTHHWDGERSGKGKANARVRHRGGQPGNHNGGDQRGNKKAEKFGFFSKYLPPDTMQIVEAMPEDPLDMIWGQIQLQYAAIIRAQQIMYVKDREDETRTLIGSGEKSDSYSVQHAWDKQASFLSAQSRALTALNSLIRQYDDMLTKHSQEATDEQKARIALMQAQVSKLTGDSEETEDISDTEGAIYDSERTETPEND